MKMRKLLLIVIILILQLSVKSQFVLTARVDTIPTDTAHFCVGDTLDLDAVKNDYLMNNNFNNGALGIGWSTNITAMWTNPCAPTLPPASGIVLWFGSNIYPRELQTVNYDIHCYNNCFIEFDMKYGANQNMNDCESPDEPTEGVHLQWSINFGTTWTQFTGEGSPSGVYGSVGYVNGTGGYWTPVSGNAATGPYYSWNHYLTQLPASAISYNTKFRWYQTLASGNTWDHWGIDNVQISCPTQMYVEWTCTERPFWHSYTLDPPPIFPLQAGTYHYIITAVDLTSNNHCPQGDTVVVIVNDPKVVINNGDTYERICNGDSALLVGKGIGLSNYKWNTIPVILNDSVVVYPTIDTSYIISAKDNLGCITKDTIKVIVNPSPNIVLNNDTICVGDTAILTASGGSFYLWTPTNLTTSSIKINPLVNTFYMVKVTSDSGCYKLDTALVLVNQVPTIQTSDKTICYGDSVILTTTGSIGQYLWIPTNLTTSSIKVTPLITTTYNVCVTDINNCKDSTKSTVVVIPLPTPIITKDFDTICKGSPINLSASGGSKFHWSTNEMTASITVYPQITTIYYVDIIRSINNVECKVDTFIRVIVRNCNSIFVPNTFVPVGYNKIFRPIGELIYFKNYKFDIYNKWGQLLFITTNPLEGWDGKYNNEYVKMDAYVYHLKFTNVDEDYEKVGTVTVIY